MPAVAAALVPTATTDRHRAFLALLPSIRADARAASRSIRCPHDREDAEADVVARAWEAFATDPADRPRRPVTGVSR